MHSLKWKDSFKKTKHLPAICHPSDVKIEAICTYKLTQSHVCPLVTLLLLEKNPITKNIGINLIHVFDIFNLSGAHAHAHTFMYTHKTNHILAHELTDEIGHMEIGYVEIGCIEIGCVDGMTCWHV